MAPQVTLSPTEAELPDAIRAGMLLASPPKGEEIVISGAAGYFPDSDSIYQFRDNLFGKVDMVTDDERRWKFDHPEIPQRTGKINHVGKFDASYFGIHYKQAHTMDPMCRLLLERSFEAIVDAGVNPWTLRGSRCGVFIGACFSETEKTWFYEKLQINGYGITGCSRAVLANRISYWLGINGPSYTVDSACSSSLYALEHAYKAIRDGHCDAALVGGSNLCLHPYVSLQFARLGVLSMDGKCKSFDNNANGYARSEAIVMIYLQKSKDAKRIYSTLVHAKTNCDGYKEQGITYPSGLMQQKLLEEFYTECRVDPSTMGYIEAHGTGTRVGDPEELTALDQVFCKGRTTPLPIGSVKSNIGHSEPASGLCSVAKCIIALEEGAIPPNLHFETPKEGVEPLENGKLKVVTEREPLTNGWVGINSFGFGGANCHVLLHWNEKTKVNGSAPQDSLPRLVVASGRTEEAVHTILNDLETRPVDVEFVKLLHDLYSSNFPGHIYRGYTLIFPGQDKPIRDIQYYPNAARSSWFIFSGLGSQWPAMGKSLLRLPTFTSAIEKCHEVLNNKGIDIFKIIQDGNKSAQDNVLTSLVGITAVQIGIVDVLKILNLTPDGIIGHSIGELAAAYADGCLSAEQTILAAYSYGLVLVETKSIKGSSIEIGLGQEEVRKLIPKEIELVSHNSPDSCTVAGPSNVLAHLEADLSRNGVSIKHLENFDIPFHSRYVAAAAPRLLKYLKQIISHPKERSSRWISTSIAESSWDAPLAKLCSAEYLTNNLLSPVLFEEALELIPNDSVTFEIAPHGILQQALQQSLHKNIINLALTEKNPNDLLESFLSLIGKLYEMGGQPQLAELYPEVKYPVSRSTPMIAPLIRWEHSEDWYVTSYRMQEKIKSGERTVVVNIADEDWQFHAGHVIDGRNLFPATGYLALVWESIGLMNGQLYTDVPIVFENIRFQRATNIPKEGNIEFTIMVQKGSGNFEVVEGGAAIVTGRCFSPKNPSDEMADLEPLEPVEGQDLIEFSSRDIYKELRLRGYNYSGLFRGLVCADNLGTTGKVQWSDNWVAFMDNMLQMQILQEDTRGLFVPTSIDKLTIDPKAHQSILQSLGEEKHYPVYAYKDVCIIRSGGVEIRGLKASGITRRKPLGEPVLEKYQFVPNSAPMDPPLTFKDVIRLCVHIALENQLGIKVKSVELIDSETPSDAEILSPEIAFILGDLPLIQAEINVLAPPTNEKAAELGSAIQVADRKLSGEQNCLLIVATNILGRTEVLQTALGALSEKGCLIAREKPDKIDYQLDSGLEIIFDQVVDNERILLLHKVPQVLSTVVIPITETSYSWLPAVQTALKDISPTKRIVLVAENEPFNGIMGLFNCIRREPGGEIARVVFILDPKAPSFSLEEPLYSDQLKKDLVANVYKNGNWGSFRHLALQENAAIKVPHCYVNVTTRGDLSSLRWLEGNIKTTGNKIEPDMKLIHVYYSALNFRDVMTATGKITAEVVAKGRINQDCVQGLEFSGRTESGERVMGMVGSRAMSTMVFADKKLLWEIPPMWSLEDAVTIPVVYGTAYFALFMSGRMQKGETVLIHAGSGGVGQAAINIALHHGCTVFTTVGTEEKREFIKTRFPQIDDSHIGNSRDTSFEQLIMLETNGRGVDLVLNSLAEEKLQASVRCLAIGGRFLEIGKFDLANNNPLGMRIFLKGTSFHGITLEKVFYGVNEWKDTLHKHLTEGIKNGAVRPLTRTSFPSNEVEQAFRYMAAGKHIGKVLINIRPEEDKSNTIPKPIYMDAVPHYSCDPDKSYIITGGLGGFGLELADWLVIRGARKLVLTSRKGLKTGYQCSRVRIWRSYDTTIKISTVDITTEEGVATLLKESNELGPVSAIFNLAVELHDAFIENQTEESFVKSAGPKSISTKFFDQLSRTLCPELEHFVIFSSVSCGRGNAGQTNYGMSNSVMERICEARRDEGLPGLAVQWGAIGEVGLVAEMQEEQHELVIGGTLQQRISSCLYVLDGFLKQPHPVVSSMVVAEKRAGSGSSASIVECVTNILGIRDLKTVSLHSTLAELGMDSMMAVEIKQSLEREFEVFLTPQDIRSMTFARLAEIAATAAAETEQSGDAVPAAAADANEELAGVTLANIADNYAFLVRVIGDEVTASLPVIRQPSLQDPSTDVNSINITQPILFMVPGIEGLGIIFETLAKNINHQNLCLQMSYTNTYTTVVEMASSLLPQIRNRLPKEVPFNLIGYSFGGMLALEIAHMLEAEGRKGRLVLIDSSPDFLKDLGRKNLQEGSEDLIQANLLINILDTLAPQNRSITLKLHSELMKLKSWEERLEFFISLDMENKITYSKDHKRALANATYNRIMSVLNYESQWNSTRLLESPTILLRPESAELTTAEDYGLSKYCKNVHVYFVEGNHATILENKESAALINNHFDDHHTIPSNMNTSSLGDKATATQHITSLHTVEKAQ
uniref:Uncharacterized protein n=1 Tax=Timema cristinae TaxID=61476 RepID=A0A7R9CRZ9_TIMCR|nr:unnamed protein product [Timema cristinae]